MTLIHIDNSFFLITASQARELSVDGDLPRYGYEKRARLDLPGVELVSASYLNLRPARPCIYQPDKADSAWIKRTRLNGQKVWAIHYHWPVTLWSL